MYYICTAYVLQRATASRNASKVKGKGGKGGGGAAAAPAFGGW